MMKQAFTGLLLLACVACAAPGLNKRVPGTWLVAHYSEETPDTNTGHTLDSSGFFTFYKNGTGQLQLIPGRPHGALGQYLGKDHIFRWQVRDSFIVVSNQQGAVLAEWLVTENYDTYMTWVSQTKSNDSTRILYLNKRY